MFLCVSCEFYQVWLDGNTRIWCWNSGKENKKGKKIVVKEEKHVCQLVFHMLQDPIKGNGWNNQMF
jgi:hypothetical protein